MTLDQIQSLSLEEVQMIIDERVCVVRQHPDGDTSGVMYETVSDYCGDEQIDTAIDAGSVILKVYN